MPSCVVGKDSFEMNCFIVGKCSLLIMVQIYIIFGNHGRCFPGAKTEDDFPVCYQRLV